MVHFQVVPVCPWIIEYFPQTIFWMAWYGEWQVVGLPLGLVVTYHLYMTCMTGLDRPNAQGAQCLDHCLEVTEEMYKIDMEGEEIASDCMVGRNTFKST